MVVDDRTGFGLGSKWLAPSLVLSASTAPVSTIIHTHTHAHALVDCNEMDPTLGASRACQQRRHLGWGGAWATNDSLGSETGLARVSVRFGRASSIVALRGQEVGEQQAVDMVGDGGSRWCRMEASACPLQRVDMAAAADCTVTCPADFRPWQTGSEDGPMGELGEASGLEMVLLAQRAWATGILFFFSPAPAGPTLSTTSLLRHHASLQIWPTPGRVGMRWLPCGAPGLLLGMQVQGVALCAVVAKSAGSGQARRAKKRAGRMGCDRLFHPTPTRCGKWR